MTSLHPHEAQLSGINMMRAGAGTPCSIAAIPHRFGLNAVLESRQERCLCFLTGDSNDVVAQATSYPTQGK
jgi:hypothetical protein